MMNVATTGRMVLRFCLIVFHVSFFIVPLSAGEPPPPDPEIERKSFEVAEGFEVQLYAADPLMAKPVQMNFDAQGRLWVVSSSIYPQLKPGEVANDKVLILEDKDGDGRCEASTVFADGLLIPTGIEIGDGGAYVANSTELIHLKDMNGDGKADSSRVILSGFGTEDTHHIIHTFRYGPDGALYFNQSIYIDSNVETPHGTKRLGGGGIWRFRPSTVELDVFVKGMCNPWGHSWDRFGQSFGTDGAGGDGIHYLVPGFTYPHFPGQGKQFPGLNRGSPKYCANETLSGRHLPESWQGSIVTNDFRANRICRFVLSEDGSGFSSKQMPELIKTKDRAFRPIDVKMGPDGAIYIADWYNPIINHGEVDFRDPRRDRTHGRIWRITAKGRPLVQKPKLVGATIPELLEHLKAQEDWTRHFAKRVLAEKDPKTVVSELEKWIAALDPKHPEIESHRQEALWVYQTLDIVEPKLLGQLLRSPVPQVRAGATRTLALWNKRLPNAIDLLSTQIADEHPRVRLEAVRAAKELKTVSAMEVAVRAVDRPMDRFLDHALTLTANDLKPLWLPAFEQGKVTFGGNPKQIQFALQAVGSAQASKILITQLKEGKTAAENQQNVLDLVAVTGGAEECKVVLGIAQSAGSGSALQSAALKALAKMAQRKVMPGADVNSIAPLLKHAEEPVRSEAMRLAGIWKAEAQRAALAEVAGADGAKTSDRERQAAIEGLAYLGGPASTELLQKLSAAEKPLNVRYLAVSGLAQMDVKAAASRAAEVLAANPAGADPAVVFIAFLQRTGGAEILATELSNKKIPADVAKLGLRAIESAAQQDSPLVSALTAAGALTAEPKELTKDDMAKLIAEVAAKGDPVRGEGIFRRQALNCTRCHAIGGAGGQVGPDLSSIGASAPVDYLVDSLLFPNKAVKENYHSVVVITKDGKVFTGIKLRQSAKEIVLRDAAGEEIVVAAENINKQRDAGSLMPSGLTDLLTHPELVDLIRFLSEIGRPGPFAVGSAPVARRWQLLDPVSHNAKQISATELKSAGLNWVPVYSQIGGTLPLADLVIAKAQSDVAIVRCQVDVSTGGKLALKLNSSAGLTLLVDGAEAPIAGNDVVLDLQTGIRNLTFKLTPVARAGTGLRCELGEVPGSPARAQFIGGK